MNYYKLQNIKELPQAEQTAIAMLLRAGVSLSEVESIESYKWDSVLAQHCIRIKDNNKNLFDIAVNADGILCSMQEVYQQVKKRIHNQYESKNNNSTYQNKLRTAYEFFSV